MEEALKEILSVVKNMDQRMLTLESRMQSIESNMATKQDLSNVNQSMTRIENTMNDKIGALFDAREVQSDVNERILASLDRIESKIGKHDIQISVLDNQKHSRRK